jgi:hypothetical protein
MVSESVFPDFFKLIQDLFAKSAELIEIPQAEAV